MGRHYSTKDFSRQMPNSLLARYFQRRGVFGGLDFAAMKVRPKGLLPRVLPGFSSYSPPAFFASLSSDSHTRRASYSYCCRNTNIPPKARSRSPSLFKSPMIEGPLGMFGTFWTIGGAKVPSPFPMSNATFP